MARTRVAVLGCGSVSEHYLTDLRDCPHADVVAVADVDPDRARARAAEFGVPRTCGSLDELLAVDFELLVNLTPMQQHFGHNLAGLEAGRHVWSEKPIAESVADGRRLLDTAAAHGVTLFAAPNAVTSPSFRCLAEQLAAGRLGRVSCARARYGHEGPSWGPWFYQAGGGPLFDLAVYNLTTLTGLLGPALGVMAMSGRTRDERSVDGQVIRAEADDNLMILLDHGDAVFSSVASGFGYGPHDETATLEIIGSEGSLSLLGWDWEPHGVILRTHANRAGELLCEDQHGYQWRSGASQVAEALATGKPTPLVAVHAFHVLEVMAAATESAAAGRRVPVASRFPAPWAG
ncbi:MAG: Gfo/Idh/MocA family oxidoreductase [Armatimonadetes bacterium]|nr:Gfo/Idh/MocA family oxidoreductase [Armatimonadota bacterium]